MTTMAGKKIQTKGGRLVLKEISFDQIYQRTVMKNNETSGKVTLPKKLVGKSVYVVVEPEE
jgi:putative transposon-encoded protein